MGAFFGTLIFVTAGFLLWRHRKRKSQTPQYGASAYPAVGRETFSPDARPSMFQLATLPSSPNGQSGFSGPEHAPFSDATRRYFPTTSHPRTSTFSHSVGSPAGSDPLSYPWIVDSTGGPVVLDRSRESAPSQTTSSGLGSSSDSPLLSSPARPSKANRMAGEIVRGADASAETPPPYRG